MNVRDDTVSDRMPSETSTYHRVLTVDFADDHGVLHISKIAQALGRVPPRTIGYLHPEGHRMFLVGYQTYSKKSYVMRRAMMRLPALVCSSSMVLI